MATTPTIEIPVDLTDVVGWWKKLKPPERLLALRLNQWGYRHRAADWIETFIDWGDGESPAKYQLAIARMLLRNPEHRIAVRSLHGSGKTALASWLVLWFFCTRDGFVDWKVITTAGSWAQLTHYLWPEIHKWARRVRWDLVGRPPLTNRELLTLAIKGETGEAFAVSTKDVALIEGAHASHLFYVFDEAKAIPDSIWNGAEGAFSNAGSDTGFEGYAFAISTAGAPRGRFYEIFHRRDRFKVWWTYHITLNKAIEAGRVSREWAESREREWGRDSALFQNRVLGNFASDDESTIIPLDWIEQSNERWNAAMAEKPISERTLTALGVDVAWQGGDKSVITPFWDGFLVGNQIEIYGEDPMRIVGRVVSILKQTADPFAVPVVVDVIGIGAGVVARLQEQGYNVIPFNGAESTNEVDESGMFGFVNRRAAAYWRVRELLDPSKSPTLALPPDDELAADLSVQRWWVSSSGKIAIESKDNRSNRSGVRSRLGRSPDKGDSVVYALSYKIENVGII